MNFIFLILLNSYFIDNNFSIGTNFYRLPNYYETNYRDVIDLNIDTFLDIKYDNILFSSYLDITEPINFDSLSKGSSYGYRKHILQAKELKLSYTWKFFNIEAGRILSWDDNFLESIDGYKFTFKYSYIKISYTNASIVTTDDFLGGVHFFDIYDSNYKENDYDLDSFTFSFLLDNYKLKLTYLNYLIDNKSDYRIFSILNNFSYNKFYLKTSFKREVNLNSDNYKLSLGYKKFGTSFEKFFPILFNSSIFNMFSRSSYKRLSIYGTYKKLKVQLLGDDISKKMFKYYGIHLDYKFLNYFRAKLRYIYNKEIDFQFYSNYKIGTLLSFYAKSNEDFYSTISKVFYKFKLQENINFELYSTFLYNTLYSFQLKGGFLLNGKL